MGKWLVVVNQAAGRKAIPVGHVQEALRAASVEVDMVVPGSSAETEEALKTAASEGRTHFALVGGDGTVNLAVNVLLNLDLDEPPTIAILPAGTGCDLLRTFGLPQELGAAATHLATAETYAIDVVTLEGSWGRRYFVNVAQVGAGAAAVETASKIPRKLGVLRYPLAFGVRLPRFPMANVTITTERRTYESEALAVIMANAQFFAGGWNVAPRATLVDGILDIQIINANKTQASVIVPKVIKGTHLGDPSVRRFTAAEFKIETDPTWPLEADGDLVGNTTVSGRVVPAAIHLKI
ncbi:MAG: YegS/Rv2252/BmrU family lipid kinase [Actinobacteria bacterium]|nr:YegS/Rv2252/BmrU family lipid kinase [Actinomycetota bacterium]